MIDIETDKVVLELPAPSAGVIVQLIKADGATVVAGEVIAIIDTEASARPARSASPQPRCANAPAAAAAPLLRIHRLQRRRRHAGRRQDPGRQQHERRRCHRHRPRRPRDQGRRPGRRRQQRCRCSGRSRPLAPSCRQAGPAASRRPAPANLGDRPEERVPMSRLRARIAERLLQSQSTNAILTTFNEVNMAPVMELRNKYKDKFEKEHGVKLGFMSFFVKAAVAALKKYPILNASVDGNDIVYHGYFDIGIAVGSPRGLVVPILRNADQMSIAEIEKKIGEFGQKAKDGKLTLEDLTGGTFSISNGGTFGSMLSTPIINPPQSAILGVHATKDRAVVENGQIVIRPMNYLAMSYDHRIIDGREAVLGLVAMKDALEDPARLLLDL
jgi:2-oxoglutarate dehydrogenase E2 component (dihydrolipoamide succinyltransferase)